MLCALSINLPFFRYWAIKNSHSISLIVHYRCANNNWCSTLCYLLCRYDSSIFIANKILQVDMCEIISMWNMLLNDLFTWHWRKNSKIVWENRSKSLFDSSWIGDKLFGIQMSYILSLFIASDFSQQKLSRCNACSKSISTNIQYPTNSYSIVESYEDGEKCCQNVD